MTGILDSFASCWYYFMFVSLGLGFVGIGLLMMWQYGNSNNPKRLLKIGGTLIGQLILTWIIGFGSLGIVQNNARKEFKNILNQENLTLNINGTELKHGDKLEMIQILKSINKVPAHHSHPTSEIIIEIEHNGNKSNLYLNKDSERQNEYWVYWDKYQLSSSNEIGRITNEKLKNYGS